MSETTTITTAMAPEDQVLAWIAEGRTERQIIEAIAEYWPDADPQTQIAKAWIKIEKTGSADPKVMLGWLVHAAMEDRKRAIANNDIPTSLRALALIDKIFLRTK